MPFSRLVRAGAVLAGLLLTAPAQAEGGHWQTQAEGINRAVTAAETTFAKGDVENGKRAVTAAYFQDFEDSKMEAAIRKHISAKRASELEKQFSNLRKAMGAGDAPQVKAIAAELRGAIAADARALDDAKVPAEVYEVNK
jgi:high-affinity iron transporter